jgi:ribosomal protein S18 acetylase RimI-like enzyme
MSRFAIREAVPADAERIAHVHVASWQDAYRGILPDDVLDHLDVGQRLATRHRILRDPTGVHVVAYDQTHLDLVGFCDGGPSRRPGHADGEIYAIYLLHRAKRYGLGTLMFEWVTARLAAAGMRSLVIWVLDDNHHARRFYESIGGRPTAQIRTRVAGFPVVEQAYVWDAI